MKRNIYFILILSITSCSSRPKSVPCTDATEDVRLTKSEATKMEGKVSQFLSDAKITQEHTEDGRVSLWRFTNMPSDSLYHQIGLREGDGIYKTNLGEQTNSINLISDLSGIPTGTTNCLYVRARDKSERVIRIQLDEK
jgi:hypothetical protein